jgi:hypothetical protein
MRIMKEQWLSLALAAALLGMLGTAAPAAAQGTVRSQTDAPINAVENQVRLARVESHTQGDVSYVSGGVGSDSALAMRQIEGGYNLRLLFAVRGSGEYLADVRVKLVDRKGNTVLDAVSDGPYFFAKLRPGRYQVVAGNGGTTISRSVDVGAHAVFQSFYWHSAN